MIWKSKRYRYLLNLIDQLPSHTRFHEAYLNNDSIAEKIASAQMDADEAESQKWAPPQRTWSPEAEMLASIIDAIHRLQATSVAVAGGKAKSPKPFPRPKSRVDHFIQLKRMESTDAIISIFQPK